MSHIIGPDPLGNAARGVAGSMVRVSTGVDVSQLLRKLGFAFRRASNLSPQNSVQVHSHRAASTSWVHDLRVDKCDWFLVGAKTPGCSLTTILPHLSRLMMVNIGHKAQIRFSVVNPSTKLRRSEVF